PEGDRAAVEARGLHEDREAESGPRFGLVESTAAGGDLLALLGGKSRAVIVDHDTNDAAIVGRLGLLREYLDRHPPLRPLAGVVHEIADHLLEVLLLTAEARALRRVHSNGDTAVVMDLLHGAR